MFTNKRWLRITAINRMALGRVLRFFWADKNSLCSNIWGKLVAAIFDKVCLHCISLAGIFWMGGVIGVYKQRSLMTLDLAVSIRRVLPVSKTA